MRFTIKILSIITLSFPFIVHGQCIQLIDKSNDSVLACVQRFDKGIFFISQHGTDNECIENINSYTPRYYIIDGLIMDKDFFISFPITNKDVKNRNIIKKFPITDSISFYKYVRDEANNIIEIHCYLNTNLKYQLNGTILKDEKHVVLKEVCQKDIIQIKRKNKVIQIQHIGSVP